MSLLICSLALLATSDAANVEDLIRNLDSDKFAERRAASQRLTEMGADVFDNLVKAAQSPSAEVQQRSLDILKTHFQNGEQATRDAARKALEKLAETDAQVAARAKQALLPPTENAVVDPFGNRVVPAQIQIQARAQAQARIQLQLKRAQQPNNVRRRIAFSDGKKTIKIEQNGQAIKVEITEKKDGKDVTKKYEAKNAEELKKNHPDAYKEYQKHMARNPVRGIPAMPAIRPINRAIPARAGRAARPLQPAQKAAQNRILEALKRSEKQVADQLEKLQAENDESKDQDQEQEQESLERRLEQLKKHRSQIEQRLKQAEAEKVG